MAWEQLDSIAARVLARMEADRCKRTAFEIRPRLVSAANDNVRGRAVRQEGGRTPFHPAPSRNAGRR